VLNLNTFIGELTKADVSYVVEDKKIMKEKSKIGHRRINDQGTVTYKKVCCIYYNISYF